MTNKATTFSDTMTPAQMAHAALKRERTIARLRTEKINELEQEVERLKGVISNTVNRIK